MKKVFSFILLLTLSLFLVDVLVKANQQEVETINVSVTTYFDDDNIIPSSVEAIYGNKVSFDNGLATNEDYTFVTWLLNDTVKYGYAIDHEFTVTKTMDLKAIFKPADQFAVLFMDANGKFLGVKFVTNGGNVEDDFTNLPTKPGYIVSENRWNGSLENVTSDKVLMLQYEPVDAEKTFTLTVVNGTSSGSEYVYNTIATVVADAPIEGQYFSHWEVNGKVVSYQETYSFTMLKDTTITAVYGDANPVDEPFVVLSENLGLRENYFSYVGQFYLPDGYELIEYGMLTLNAVDEELNINTQNIIRHQGNKYDSRTNEWLMSFYKDSIISTRAYMVVKDGSNNLRTFYSDVIVEVVLRQTLIYETGFEDVSNTSSYQSKIVTSNGVNWNINDVYISSSDQGDKKSGSKSIRIRDGHLALKESFSNISIIEFKFANYSNDSGGKLLLSISIDEQNWIDLLELDATSTLTKHVIKLDEIDNYINASIPKEIPIYIMFKKQSGKRLNIDDVKLYGLGELGPSKYVRFEENGGSVVEDVKVPYATKVSKPANPTKEGYTFEGWYIDSNFTEEFDFNTIIRDNITLYAKWEKIEEITIEQARSLNDGDFLITRGIVTMRIGNNAFIQDSTGGIYIYGISNSDLIEKLSVGNEIVISGKRGSYNNLAQITDVSSIEVISTNNELPLAVELTDLSNDAFYDLEGQIVTIRDLTIKSIPSIGTTSFNVTVTNGIVDFEIRVNNVLANFNDFKELFESAIVGLEIDLVNVVAARYNDTPQVFVSMLDQILIGDPSEQLFETTLKPNELLTGNIDLPTSIQIYDKLYTLIWSSSNPDIITDTGIVNIPSMDTVVILTVTVKLGDTVLASIEYEVTVLAESNEPELVLNYDFGAVSKTGYAAGTLTFINGDGKEVTLVKDRVQINAPSDKTQMLILGAIKGNDLAFIEFDLSMYANVTRIQFDYTAWNDSAITNINRTTDPLFGLQVFNEATKEWETLTSIDGKTTLTNTVTTNLQTVTYDINSGSKFRLVVKLNEPSSTSNTAYAMAVDNFKVWAIK